MKTRINLLSCIFEPSVQIRSPMHMAYKSGHKWCIVHISLPYTRFHFDLSNSKHKLHMSNVAVYFVQIRDVGRFLAKLSPWTNTFGNWHFRFIVCLFTVCEILHTTTYIPVVQKGEFHPIWNLHRVLPTHRIS